jgi:hypothetical protein
LRTLAIFILFLKLGVFFILVHSILVGVGHSFTWQSPCPFGYGCTYIMEVFSPLERISYCK